MADAKRGGGGGGEGGGEGRKAGKRGKRKVAAFLALPPYPLYFSTPATHAKQNTEFTTHRFCFPLYSPH